MSENKNEKIKAPMSKKKKIILALVVLGLFGGGYYSKLWLEAQNRGVSISNLDKARKKAQEDADFYNNF